MQISSKHLYYFCYLIIIVSSFSSCSVDSRVKVKDYPVDTPFVYDNKIILKGDLTKDDRKSLSAGLVNYWDDSLYAQRVQKFGFFYTIKNPPVYDSANRQRTGAFMTGYLKSLGYYYSQIKDTVVHSYYKNQHRVTVIDTIYTGKQMIIDSLKYALVPRRLQIIADSSKKASLIEPGKSPFAKNLIGAELERLVYIYRRRGFFLLTRDNLIAEADTLDQSLLTLPTDPFEQARKIAEAIENKKLSPSTTVTIMKRENTDTSFQRFPDSAYFKQYKIGHIYYFPEASLRNIADSVIYDSAGMKAVGDSAFTMYYTRGLFNYKALRNFTQLRQNTNYNEDNFNRTVANFNQLPAWNQVDYRTNIRDNFVDFYFVLSPARRQNITLAVEGSRNSGDFLSTGTLIGTAFNITYNNRNMAKRAHQLTATLSNGVEFTFDKNYPFLQTFSSTFNLAYTFPNVPLFFTLARRTSAKIDVSPSYSERSNFFRIRSATIGITWEWRTRKQANVFQVRLPNLESYSLDTLPLLIEAFKDNPFLRTSFNTGSVVGAQFSFTRTIPAKNNINTTNYYHFAAEASIGGKNVYDFIKVEAEYRRQMNLSKGVSFAFRGFAAAGKNFGNNPAFGSTLPFFKQFVAGGPNSMRAWGLRQLGLGSNVLADSVIFRERFGDMQLETNAELRFNIASFSAVKVASALFVDAGNIWNIEKNAALPGAEFDISRLSRDIAIGVGTGLRFDFNYFLVRLDMGIKLKDPARQTNNGWLRTFTWTEYQAGYLVNNYAVQLGIGLPF